MDSQTNNQIQQNNYNQQPPPEENNNIQQQSLDNNTNNINNQLQIDPILQEIINIKNKYILLEKLKQIKTQLQELQKIYLETNILSNQNKQIQSNNDNITNQVIEYLNFLINLIDTLEDNLKYLTYDQVYSIVNNLAILTSLVIESINNSKST